MEHRLAGGAEKFPRERQNVRRPCTGCHYDQVTAGPLSIVEDNTLHPTITYVQRGELATLVQFDAELFCAIDKQRDHASTFNVACLLL